MLYPARPEQDRRITLAAGVVATLFGLVAIFWPNLTLTALLVGFAVYVLVYGVIEVVGAYQARRENRSWWPQSLIGGVAIAAGLVTLFYPAVTTTLLVYFIAVWALAIGISEVVGAMSLRSWLLGIVGAVTAAAGFVLFGNAHAGALALVWVIGILFLVRGVLLLLEMVQPSAGPHTPA